MPQEHIKKHKLLNRVIIIRLTEHQYEKLHSLKQESRAGSIGEVCRRVLDNRKIKILHVDSSVNPVLEQLISIRRELKMMGVNINQISRKINSTHHINQQSVEVTKASAIFEDVGKRVDGLLEIVDGVSRKWLQG